ncbi:LacI family DNA-binding transcriptional regulator [Dinghuibacter silviterrae]|uniref:LacI family transcriptional regulator n=1 Tax=Dinghuibacter silviterrae TaxID=1539049 RepID=A0A4R8DUM0_9BACT|nr:LacI family transcriptional regulator [Dinghuibacter silviterrae]
MKRTSEHTIKDIAEALGLSPSTVSRALQDYPHTSQATKARVREVVEKMGYRHNAVAASLRNNKSRTIGLIIPRISMYFHAEVVTVIQNKLHESGYHLMICQSNDQPDLEKELVNALYSARVDGLIVATTSTTTDFTYFDIFRKNHIPLVFYDRVPKDYPSHKISGDEYQGGLEATLHLLEHGCRRIAHIGGPLTSNIYRDRYMGYLAAHERYKVAPDPDLLFFHELTKDNALKTGKALLARKHPPDAIFACNDTTAIALLGYAREIGLDVPGDLKLVGYSNDPRTEIITPSITTVEQFPRQIGEKAAQLILDLIGDKQKPVKGYINLSHPIELIRRNSS